MIDVEILEKVKSGLSVSGVYNDDTLKIKALAVKQYMLNAGITVEQIETDLGIATLTVGVSDLWNISSGEVKFSPAFSMLITQLQVVCISDTVVI